MKILHDGGYLIAEHFEGLSEHGIFHGITFYQEIKPLNIKDRKGLFTIEWEWPAQTGNVWHWLASQLGQGLQDPAAERQTV